MRKFEIALTVLLLSVIALRLANVTGSSLFLFIISLAIFFVYTIFGFAILNDISISKIFRKSSYQSLSTARIVGTVLIGWLYAVLVMAILFKFQLWEGAGLMLVMYLISAGAAIVLMTLLYFRRKRKYLITQIARMGIISGIALLIFLVPKIKLIEIYYGDNPEYVELYKEYLDNRDDPELRAKFQKASRELHSK